MPRKKVASSDGQKELVEHERIPQELKALAVDIQTLKPYSKNPRNGDTDVIKDSLVYHGQYRPIVVRKGTNEILAGNHTFAAAMELEWSEIAVTYVECTDEQAKRIVLVDNRTNDLAKYDDGLLLKLLGELPDLDATGYDETFLERLTEKVNLEVEERFDIIVKCKDISEQNELANELKGRGIACQILGS